MLHHQITDWTRAYTNDAYIPAGDSWPDVWDVASAAFRRASAEDPARARFGLAYGPHARHRFDLFLPRGKPKGLVVFVHGGYWLALDETTWSHLAAGPLQHGFAVAIPTYRLCPEVRIADITRDVGHAITAAAGMIDGPIVLTGHSAGGHLVTRMISVSSPLSPAVTSRIRNVVSISGLHDLRPLLRTAMNDVLHLDTAEAAAESPALLMPMADARLTCWVGGSERPEFRRQTTLLANIWQGLGAATLAWEEPDRHHFTICDGLADPASPLVSMLLDF